MILNDEDKLLLSKAKDKSHISETKSYPTFIGFLNEHQKTLLENNFDSNRLTFYGGYENPIRVILGFNAEISDFKISSIKFSYKQEYELSHRDILGTLMSLGIQRDVIGDILVFSGYSVVFLKDEIVPLVLNEVNKIKNVGVKTEIVKSEHFVRDDKFEDLVLSVSSFRLDVIVSSICSLSRDKSNKLINSELVNVNYFIETNNSSVLKIGDIITIRKFGKFVLSENLGISKKGKFRILIKHYI